MPYGNPSSEPVRLAELIAALSLGIDLGFAQPMEHVLRQCRIALRLADQMGLGEEDRSTVYYTALLVNVGCHSDAHEQAKWFGDDIAMKARKYDHDLTSVRSSLAVMRMLGSGNPVLQRLKLGVEFARSGRREFEHMVDRHAAMAERLAGELGLPAAVQEAVGASYEQWDGKGFPGRRKGEAVPVAARLASFAEFVEVAHRLGGVDAAVALAQRQRGRQFDPDLADALASRAHDILGGLDGEDTWDAVIASEPALTRFLDGDDFDRALTAIADFVDLKSPYTLGHSRAVAELAADAGAHLGLAAEEITLLRRAALASGLGRLGVSNAIWDKPGPLGTGERERVRMHPYLTERMLQQSPALAPLGAIAAQHRERLDGLGYPRGLSGPAISRPARILGAVDAYVSMCEVRPYRPALTPAQAADEVRREVRAGRLDQEAVGAVLLAAGHRVPRRAEGPAGLTAREVEVLCLVARGLSSKQIAAELIIAPKTARNHIEHVYSKIGASSRVQASLFAIQNGLLGTVAKDGAVAP